MLKNKILCGIACIAISFVSAMDNTKKLFGPSALSFKKVKINPVVFNNEKEKNKKLPAQRVVLIDKNGRIPEKTLGKMSINSSTLLSEYHPKALDNCHNYNDKNEIIAIVKMLHGAPKAWQGLLLEQLGLKSKNVQAKFKSLPLGDALASLAEASGLHDGLLKKYTVDQLFDNLNRNELLLSHTLSKHFSQGHSKIEVDRTGYNRIANLPEEVREEFHNKKEFFKVELMPSLFDEVISVATHGVMGGVLGSGVGGITGFGLSSAMETVVYPALGGLVSKVASNMLGYVAFGIYTGMAHRYGINNGYKAIAVALINKKSITSYIYNIVKTVPKAYVRGFLNNPCINNNLFYRECTMEKIGPHFSNQVFNGSTSLSHVGFKSACGEAINSAQSFGLYGALVGVLYGLSTVNTPIVTENISKL